MRVLVAHLRTLKTWLFFGGWHRLFLFLSSIPILWLFWTICCPALVVGEIDLKNTFLSLFAAWYSLSYLQDLTRNESAWGLSSSFHLPTCPALPIGPLKRLGAEFLFFFIIATLVFIPFFLLRVLAVSFSMQPNITTVEFLLNAIQGTLAIAPIIFCIRMNVHATFILPATLRMALPVLLCCAFFLFQITGLYTTLLGSTALFIVQISILCVLFMGLREKNSGTSNKRWVRYLSRHFFDDELLGLLLGSAARRTARPLKTQCFMDLGRFTILYISYWICFYFPLIGSLYYFFICFFEKPAIHWFFFFLLFILPVQDSHAFKNRLIAPMLSMPLKKDVVMRRFYLLFTLAVIFIWTVALLLVTLSKSVSALSLLPLMFFYAPTMAGIWINRITNKPVLVFIGMAMLLTLPLGVYLNLTQNNWAPLFLSALIGALLPFKSLFSHLFLQAARDSRDELHSYKK